MSYVSENNLLFFDTGEMPGASIQTQLYNKAMCSFWMCSTKEKAGEISKLWNLALGLSHHERDTHKYTLKTAPYAQSDPIFYIHILYIYIQNMGSDCASVSL